MYLTLVPITEIPTLRTWESEGGGGWSRRRQEGEGGTGSKNRRKISFLRSLKPHATCVKQYRGSDCTRLATVVSYYRWCWCTPYLCVHYMGVSCFCTPYLCVLCLGVPGFCTQVVYTLPGCTRILYTQVGCLLSCTWLHYTLPECTYSGREHSSWVYVFIIRIWPHTLCVFMPSLWRKA